MIFPLRRLLVCMLFSLSMPLQAIEDNILYRLQMPVDAAIYLLAPYRLNADSAGDARPYARQIAAAAQAADIDPELVHALIAVESAYRASAVSSRGALGLMQLMPATAQMYGIDDARQVTANLSAGTRHVKALLQRFDNRLELVLAAYNAGEGAVQRYGEQIPPYAETRRYVPAVIARYQLNKGGSTPAIPRHVVPRDYLAGTRLNAEFRRQSR